MRWAILTTSLALAAVSSAAFGYDAYITTADWNPAAQLKRLPLPDEHVPGILPVAYEKAEAASLAAGCKACGKDGCCGPRTSIFAEYLLLTPRDAEIAYAIPIDGPIAAGDPRIPIGPTAMVNPDYDSGFRVGMSVPLDCCYSLVATYTWYNSDVSDSAKIDAISPDPDDVFHPLVIHPSTVDAATDVTDVSAHLAINFQFVDIDYKGIWYQDECCRWLTLVGVRYAHLDQNFASQFNFTGTTDVLSEVRFDGGGIRFGLEGERYCWGGFMLYAKGAANFVAGDFQGRYFQGDAFDPVVTEMTWSASRVVTILEVELGFGWQSCNGRWRANAGYVFNAWLNAVQPDEIIRAGQTNNFAGIGDGLSFDGLALRFAYRF